MGDILVYVDSNNRNQSIFPNSNSYTLQLPKTYTGIVQVKIISSILKFKIPPEMITYNEITGGGTSPHSEHVLIQTVLNFYIEPGKCSTLFWKLKNLSIESELLPRLDDSGNWSESVVKVYTTDSLVCEASFIANPNEAYILGVDKIHSVSKSITTDVRKFIRLGWVGYDVEEIFNSIEIL
jgi:hypothetical protein